MKIDGAPNVRYGLGLMDTKLTCGVHVWGHGGGIHGSTSAAATTADGRHSLALNFNGDWTGDTEAVIEGEFCQQAARLPEPLQGHDTRLSAGR